MPDVLRVADVAVVHPVVKVAEPLVQAEYIVGIKHARRVIKPMVSTTIHIKRVSISPVPRPEAILGIAGRSSDAGFIRVSASRNQQRICAAAACAYWR